MDETSGDHHGAHQTTGRWRLGLLLTLACVLLWSTVPIALSLLLPAMHAVTITWYRFLAATLVLGVFLRSRGTLSRLSRLGTRRSLELLAVAAIGLTGSFILYISSLEFIPPGASAVVYQLSTYFMLFGGVVLFRESFRREQWLGLGALTLGLGLFFNQRFALFIGHDTDYSFGVLLVVFASIVWASYALAQKQLLSTCSSAEIMFLLYALGVVMMFPLTSLDQISGLSLLQYVVLAYASTNALLAYACFAEALQHWEASRVSAMMATVPLLTLGMSSAAHGVWPEQVKPEELNLLALIGAVLVVVGSVLAALGGRRKRDGES